MGASVSKQLPPGFKDFKNEFDQEEIDAYQTAFINGGLSGLKTIVDEKKDKWKKQQVKIAVTGESGVGKSSFINCFRGLKARQEGAAAVGSVETTKTIKQYQHPNNENIVLLDLPGVGTPNFPKEKYLEEVKFREYDFFLILTAGRFRENDLWLANEVRNQGKTFFFIRTKIDDDVRNEQFDNGRSVCDTVDMVRKSIVTNAENDGFKNLKVFLVNNRSSQEYDFPDFQDTMLRSAPEMKREAMTFSLTNLTEDLIEMKKAALLKRIMRVSLASAIGGAVPIPGVSLAIDTSIVMNECKFYREQFGLDDDSLRDKAGELGMTVERLKAQIQMKSHILGIALKETLAIVGTLAVSEAAETVTSLVLPIIGSAISASISYGSTVSVLMSILDIFVTDAKATNTLLMKQMFTSTQV